MSRFETIGPDHVLDTETGFTGKIRKKGGYIIFIKDEEYLEDYDVVKRSGKFEKKQKIQDDEVEDIRQIKNLLKNRKISQEQYDKIEKETIDYYNKRLKGKDSLMDIPEAYRHYEQDYEHELMNKEYGIDNGKLPEEKDYLPGGKKWNKEWESAREYKLKYKTKQNQAREIDNWQRPSADVQKNVATSVAKAFGAKEVKVNGETVLLSDTSPMSEYSDTTGTGLSDKQMANIKFKNLPKTKEQKVMRGNYGYGWEDLEHYDKDEYEVAKENLRLYRENEPKYQFNLSNRRVPVEYKQRGNKKETFTRDEIDIIKAKIDRYKKRKK